MTTPVARLYGAAELHTRDPGHAGCLGVNGVLAGSDEAEPVRQALIDFRADGEALLRARFERAQGEGELPQSAQSAQPAVLAAFVMAVMHGMAVQAKAGFSRAMLEAVVAQALSTWPAGSGTAGAPGD